MYLLSPPLPIPILHSSTHHYTSLNPLNSPSFHFHRNPRLSIRASAVPLHRNSANFPASGEVLCRIAASAVLFVSLGSALFAFRAIASTDVPLQSPSVTQLQEQESQGNPFFWKFYLCSKCLIFLFIFRSSNSLNCTNFRL